MDNLNMNDTQNSEAVKRAELAELLAEFDAAGGRGVELAEAIDALRTELGEDEPQTYRIEVRFDFTGTQVEARAAANEAAGKLGGEVTAIFDEDFEEI
jgi:hypothetical protein